MLNEQKRIPQTLRDYQREAVAAIKAATAKGEKPICAAATGGGKTTILAQALVEMVDPLVQRALVIAHTEEIIGQLYNRIADQFGGDLDQYFGWMKPGIGIVMGDRDDVSARIVIATRQSLHAKRLARVLEHGKFDVLVIDECHHAIATEKGTYNTIVKTCETANPDLIRFGMTATPMRSDKHALESLWSNICYEWSIETGIETGYLAPVTRLNVQTKVDLNGVKTSKGDYDQKRLNSALRASNWLDLCLQAHKQYIAGTGRLTLAFMPSLEMSQQFVAALKATGHAAAHIDGETPKELRRTILKDYAAGKIRTISNFGVLVEGFDAPETGAIFLGRPTRSKAVFTQMLGRGLRLFPGKQDCLLVDLTVQDTKALQRGNLTGRMFHCSKCKAEYWAFLTKCPQCGYERPKPPPEESIPWEGEPEEWRGGELVAVASALFENAAAAWYSSHDGTMSCMLDFDAGAMFITPPGSDGYYRLYRVPKTGKEPVAFVARNDDVAALIRTADDVVHAAGKSAVERTAAWRKTPATPAQMNMISNMGVLVNPGMTKGQASETLAHLFAAKRLRAELEKQRKARMVRCYFKRTEDVVADRTRLRWLIDVLQSQKGEDRFEVVVVDSNKETHHMQFPNHLIRFDPHLQERIERTGVEIRIEAAS